MKAANKIMKSSDSSTVSTLVMTALLVASGLAVAGGGGTEFATVYDSISGWASGVLGKTIAVSALLVGLGIGVIKQSAMAAVVGVACALVAGYGPDVIDGIVSAAVTITEAI